MVKRIPYKYRTLSSKQKLDVDTMAYFIPSRAKRRIYINDKKKMAFYSATGEKPKRSTKGFELLKWGRTYRDEQIASYRRDIALGLFTKYELAQSMPNKRLKRWLWSKIAKVPYDVDGLTSQMLVRMYRRG